MDFFRCLEQETALRLLIFWLGEGWYEITENSLSCARESLAQSDISDYFAGVLPDASSESAEVSRQMRRVLLACNLRPLRDSLRHSGPGITETEQLCLRSRFEEELVAWLVGREPEAGSDPWQAQVFRCLGHTTVARMLFQVLPTEAGGVFKDQESCVSDRFTQAGIAGGMLPASHPDRAAAVQTLVDGLRSCIPDLILSGEDAHPVDRRLRMFTITDSSCVNIEIGETFLNLVLGKPFRPNPDIVLTMQGCFVKPTAAAISLAILSREVDGITGEHEACVRTHLANAEFNAALLPAARPSSTPGFQEFAAGYRACIADLLPSVDDGIGSAKSGVSPLWRFSAGGPVVPAPTVSGGIVYAGSDDKHIYALDAATGEMLWSFATGDVVRSSPTVSDGVVYVGSNDNHLYALDAASGGLLWKIDTGDWVQYRPIVSDGVVYLSVQDRGGQELHAVDAMSGERIWASDIPITFTPDTAPAAVGFQVYVTDVAGDVLALSASTGDILWTITPPDALTAELVAAGGKVYLKADIKIYAVDEMSGGIVWSQDYYYTLDRDVTHLPPLIVDDVVYFSTGESIISIDAETGETQWSYRVAGSIDTPPAIAQGLVYIGSDGAQFYAADPSKTNYRPEELVWGFDVGARTLRHPMVTNGVLYAQSSDGKLEAFNADNGHLIWTFDLGELTDRKSFTVVEDTVYAGAEDGSVHAIVTEMPVVAEVTAAPETTPVVQVTPTPQDASAERERPFGIDHGISSYSSVTNDDRARIDARVGGKDLTLLATWRRPNNIVQWSADSSRILFVVGPEVYQIASDGSGVQSLVNVSAEMRRTAGPDYQDWAFHAVDVSQDGAYISYSTFEHPERPVEYNLPTAYEYEIGILEIESGLRKGLTVNRSYDDYPAWSPDASKVAFVQWDFDSGYGLRTVDMDSSQETVVVSGFVLPREATNRQTPVWSPDGARIAFVGFDRNEVQGPAIYTVGADGSDLQVVTATNSRPAWSPDGKRIAFAKPDGDELALYTIGADGSDLQRVTKIELSSGRASYGNINVERDEPGSSGYARSGGGIPTDYEAMEPKDIWVDTMAWSPDGSMIMYGCGPLICVAKADGTQIGTSPIGLRQGMTGAWSPDGLRIAIGRLELRRPAYDDGVALYTMAPDGSDLRLFVRHDSEGDLHLLGVRPTPDHVSTAGCAGGAAVADPADNPGLVRDCETLLSIRDVLAASPPLDWTDDRPITSWEGVAIGGTPPRVRSLDVRHRGLSGVFPTELTALTQLRELDLSWNKLSGNIPPEVGTLARLSRLDLFANNLTGVIPKEIGNLSNLTFLNLDSMYLQGIIPAELGQLTQLELLNLGNNHLTGPIPPELTKLRGLRYLRLGANRLTGPILPEIGNLRNLSGLSLGGNQLSGEIPPELGQLTGLGVLKLSYNQLTGAIPPELGSLTLVRELFLHNNQLSGPIPATFGNLRSMWYLHVNDNQLTGPIPAELGNLSEMSELYLYNNQLDGPIPSELGRLENLLYLIAHGNRLTGPIPPELSGLSSLWTLSLSNNRIDGPIPPELGLLPSLESLRLDNNQLTGSIPPEIGQLGTAWGILLNNNQLTGSIPPEIGRLSNVRSLWLQGNQLSGEIPPEIGQLFELENLNLADNQLSGAIPIELFEARFLREVKISGNQLTGTIPSNLFGVLMDHVDLSNNQLTGPIPPEAGENFGLRRLDLSNNQLTGPIPVTLGGVVYLQALFLDGNTLTGEIPREFAGLFRLEEINLAGNQLSGCIPSALRFAVIHEFESLGLLYCEN